MDDVEPKQIKQIVQLSRKAYAKIAYHCLRYPSSKVYGLLVGQNANFITDAYPLCHTVLINPILSIAMNLVESNLRSTESIIGIYQFIENSSSITQKIIQSSAALKDMLAMRVWVGQEKEETTLRLTSATHEFTHVPYSELKKALIEGQHRLIVDFDAHFEDISLDFRNLYVK